MLYIYIKKEKHKIPTALLDGPRLPHTAALTICTSASAFPSSFPPSHSTSLCGRPPNKPSLCPSLGRSSWDADTCGPAAVRQGCPQL